MTIFSCWNGSFYELFSVKASAEARAKAVLSDLQDQGHPLGSASVSELVEEGAPRYKFTPGRWVETIIMNQPEKVYAWPSESPECRAGDDSPEVAAAVDEWWKQREAVRNAFDQSDEQPVAVSPDPQPPAATFTLLCSTSRGWTNQHRYVRSEFASFDEARDAAREMGAEYAPSKWRVVPTADLGSYGLMV